MSKEIPVVASFEAMRDCMNEQLEADQIIPVCRISDDLLDSLIAESVTYTGDNVRGSVKRLGNDGLRMATFTPDGVTKEYTDAIAEVSGFGFEDRFTSRELEVKTLGFGNVVGRHVDYGRGNITNVTLAGSRVLFVEDPESGKEASILQFPGIVTAIPSFQVPGKEEHVSYWHRVGKCAPVSLAVNISYHSMRYNPFRRDLPA